jgi:MFS family permease
VGSREERCIAVRRNSKLLMIAYAGLPAFAYMFTVGSIGFWLPLFVKEEVGYTYLETELIATVYFASLALGGVLAGYMTDKSEKPNLTAFAGLAINALVIYLMPRVPSFSSMLVLRIVQGLGLSTAIPVALGSLSLLAGETLGVGFTSLFMSTGMAVGSLFGGIIIHSEGYTSLFDITAVLSLAAALASLQIRVPRRRQPRISFKELFHHVRGRVSVVLLGITLRQVLSTGVYALLVVYFKTLLGLNLIETALALSINPVVQGILSIPLSRYASKRGETMFSLGILLTSLVFTLIYLASKIPWLAYASMVTQGIAFAMVSVSGNYIVISSLPEKIRYTASSLFNLGFNLGWIIGTAITGIVLVYIEPLRWLLIASGSLILLSLLIFLLFRRCGNNTL